MILYLDTSACVKKYFKENSSAEVIAAWKSASLISTSAITYAETVASLHRKKREAGVRDRIFSTAMKSFHADWESFLRVEITRELDDRILSLVKSHPLRGFDAIHLASALTVAEHVPDRLVFACYDKQLCSAARAEGLEEL